MQIAAWELENWPSDDGDRSETSASDGPSDAREITERLERVVETEIMPTLNRFHGGQLAFAQSLAGVELEPNAIDDFLTRLLRQDYASTVEYLDRLHRRPLPLIVLFSELLAPAARKLGEMWFADECSFVDVTVGVSHLQQLVRDFSAIYAGDLPESTEAGSILLLATSGEQHTFGLCLIGEYFRRAGWEVFEAPEHDSAELVALLSNRHFDAIGFSLACIELFDALEDDIATVREKILADGSLVLAGGAAFGANAHLNTRCSADFVASNVEDAILAANAFVRRAGRGA